MVIRPYRVRYLNDLDGESYTQHVVYCEHWERATWLALYLRARIRKRREIECLIQSGEAWSERVEGWFFRPSASLNKANGVLRHAASEKEIRLLGEKAYSIHTELEFIRVDELAMLQALSDEELCWQCRYVWGGLNSELLKERGAGGGVLAEAPSPQAQPADSEAWAQRRHQVAALGDGA